jgi:hypothetical protein
MKTIRDIVEDFRESDPPLTYLSEGDPVAPDKFTEFEVVNWNGTLRIVPTEALKRPGRPRDPSFMYRGQTVPYPTCEASLLRGVHDQAQIAALLTLERFRVAELELVLRDHPFKAISDKQGYHVDYHGLAQHYGIRTSLLDLTSSVEVAAFFAIARWDKESHVFRPMEAGTGVMYRWDWAAFGRGYSTYISPVGFGPGLRPARQHAWTFRLEPRADFQRFPHVSTFEFTHSKMASEELFAKFDESAWLYPPDCLASLVETVRDLPYVTTDAIRHVAKQRGRLPEEVEPYVEAAARFLDTAFGLPVEDGYVQPLEEDLQMARQQASTLEDAFGKHLVGVRTVRRLRPGVDEKTAL